MNSKITIDLSKYCTQSDYAKETGTKLGTVSQWVKRTKEGKSAKIEYLYIPELQLTLVKRFQKPKK